MDRAVQVVYAREEPPEAWRAAVFLAGPSPRSRRVASWRPDAVERLRRRWRGDGLLVVFVPEPRAGAVLDFGQDGQIEWEERCLHLADVVLFWVPRDLATLPAFTTNVEWGMWHDSGRVVFGAPPEAPKNGYLLHYARKHRVPVSTTLDGTVDAALRKIGGGADRGGGERSVPLRIWRLDSFHRWYAAQRGAGNTLRSARVVWTHGDDLAFYWALHVQVHVAAENRVKTNEVVLSRPDLSVVALYRPGPTLEDTEVVLVREYRSPGSTPDGFVHELPGGAVEGPRLDQAVREVAEETGLVLDPARLRPHGSRQLAATVSAHHAHLYSAELTGPELAGLSGGRVHGDHAASERTVPEVTTFGRIRAERLVDWATLGMLAEVLTEVLTAPDRR